MLHYFIYQVSKPFGKYSFFASGISLETKLADWRPQAILCTLSWSVMIHWQGPLWGKVSSGMLLIISFKSVCIWFIFKKGYRIFEVIFACVWWGRGEPWPLWFHKQRPIFSFQTISLDGIMETLSVFRLPFECKAGGKWKRRGTDLDSLKCLRKNPWDLWIFAHALYCLRWIPHQVCVRRQFGFWSKYLHELLIMQR